MKREQVLCDTHELHTPVIIKGEQLWKTSLTWRVHTWRTFQTQPAHHTADWEWGECRLLVQTLYKHNVASASLRWSTVCSRPTCHVSTGPASPPSALKTRLALSLVIKRSWEIQQLLKKSSFQITRGMCVRACVVGREGSCISKEDSEDVSRWVQAQSPCLKR